MQEMIETAVQALLSLIRLGHVFKFGLSGGKDSGTVTILGLEAIRRAKLEGIVQGTHYVASADTLIENPAMVNHLAIMHEEIEAFCAKEELPVEIKLAIPALASQFVVSTIGRGTLVRTPENSVKGGKRKRPCADDWKVKPMAKLGKVLAQEVRSQGFAEPITVLGMRSSESSSRAGAMAARNDNALVATRDAGGNLTLSIIADWTTDDVWEFLGLFNNPGTAPFPSFTDGRSITRMTDLYREGNEGVCGVILGESGNRAACGSRFGCALCLATGDRDKSMESMIKEPKHAHLAGLSQFRNYLIRTQWDMSKRELIGRKLSPAGYLKVKPDTYSMKHRLDLLGMILTLDVLEQERAEQHEADLVTGRIPDTPDNRELAGVQFQLITPQQLVAIDFQLSLHHYAPHAFPAVTKWFEVYENGRRYSIPDVAPLSKVEIKSAGWFDVGNYDRDVPTDGLRSYLDECWNKYRHPDRPATHCFTSQGEQVTWFEETDGLQVDAEAANAFVTCSFDLQYLLECQHHHAIESARFWLNEEIVSLARGTVSRYQEMAKRGQYFANLADKLNVATTELDAYLIKHAISESEHQKLVDAINQEETLGQPQTDLFKIAA